jgi:3-methyladenine DNA glycosylase/8-oxoguanine DNA glycosylase
VLSLSRVWRPGFELDVRRTLGQLQRGHSDPTFGSGPDGSVWWASRTPEGLCTLRVAQVPGGAEVAAEAWGPGAGWWLERLPDLLGARDDPGSFTARHDLVRDAVKQHRGLRMPRTGLVFAALVPSVLEQRVTTVEARAAYKRFVFAYGEPAPGPAPAGLRVPPEPAAWARIPSWEWRRAGVDDQRARTVLRAAAVAASLERLAGLADQDAAERLKSVPGIGVWTCAETMQRSHGAADALSVGDLHLAKGIGFALTGAAVDDAGMLELLEPYRGHRHRAALLIRMTAGRTPRRGPRLTPGPHPAVRPRG